MANLGINDIGDPSLNLINNNINFDFTNNILYSSFFSKIFSEFDIKCKYYSETTAACALKSIGSPFISCVGINIQSINSKFSELLNFLSLFNSKGVFLDFLFLNETWAADFTRFHINNYNIYYASRKTNSRGGACIYINSKFTSSQITHPSLFTDAFWSLF